MNSFHVSVRSVREALLLLDTLAYYDLFQYENNIKPDYCNAGGLEIFEDYDLDDERRIFYEADN